MRPTEDEKQAYRDEAISVALEGYRKALEIGESIIEDFPAHIETYDDLVDAVRDRIEGTRFTLDPKLSKAIFQVGGWKVWPSGASYADSLLDIGWGRGTKGVDHSLWTFFWLERVAVDFIEKRREEQGHPELLGIDHPDLN